MYRSGQDILRATGSPFSPTQLPGSWMRVSAAMRSSRRGLRDGVNRP